MPYTASSTRQSSTSSATRDRKIHHLFPLHRQVTLTWKWYQILAFDRCIMAWHRSNETSKRLDAIPGVGPALATALVASVADPKAFRSGRDFSAWIGLVPKQNTSGGQRQARQHQQQGDRYLRSLFTAGALAVIRYAKLHGTMHRPWLTALLGKRGKSRGGIIIRFPKASASPDSLREWRRLQTSMGFQTLI